MESVEFVDRHFAPESLDVVMLCGVIGWGLDDPEVADRSIAAIFEVLRPGGVFVISISDVPAHLSFPVQKLGALGRFTPWVFPTA